MKLTIKINRVYAFIIEPKVYYLLDNYVIQTHQHLQMCRTLHVTMQFIAEGYGRPGNKADILLPVTKDGKNWDILTAF